MRPVSFCLPAILLLSITLNATPVSRTKAISTAQNFLRSVPVQSGVTVRTSESPDMITENDLGLIYIVKLYPQGFILVSADDASYPVLAYSFESDYGAASLPENFASWLEGYKNQIRYGAEHSVAATRKVQEAWNLYNSEIPNPDYAVASVEPLLTSTWDQGSPYNELCPADPAGPSGHVWAGCVATAMAQVANYWRWPLQGTGSHSYNSAYGYLSADFGNTRYKWEEMTNSGYAQCYEMAQLQSHMGIAVDMMYSPTGSGAYSSDAANALIDYFGMDAGLHLEYAPDSIDETWKSLLRSELDAGRPIYYHGFGSGGHAFNVDGYQGNDFFHFNWGWSGSYNGYYYLDNLNPGGANFTEGQGAIVGIMPTGNYPYYCNSTDTLTSLRGSIEDGSGPVAPYLAQSNCGWLIQPLDSILTIKLSFNRFDLETNDYLTVYDGPDNSSPVLGSFTGSTVPPVLASTGGSMFIKFTSDSDLNQGGWFATYVATRAIYCSGMTTFTTPEGSFDDGSGTFEYHSNSVCRYRIAPDSARSITLTFDDFATYDENDYIKVYNLEDNTLIYTLSGQQNPGTLYINSGKILLMFHSDNLNNAAGWSCRYTSSVLTGTEESPAFVNLNVYPNPAGQYLRVTANLKEATVSAVSLTTLQGTILIRKGPGMNTAAISETLDVSQLASGLYLLRVETSAGSLTRKVAIRH